MLCEGFRKLEAFAPLQSYRYIGFGSTYFSDVALFHKNLGITDMISIEKHVNDIDRMRFNRPFKCIDIRPGQACEVLPTVGWGTPTIIWLDYDDPLDLEMLGDLAFVCASACTPSVVLVTANCQATGPLENRLAELRRRVGDDKVPRGLTNANMAGWAVADVYREIIKAEIEETLSRRNGALQPTNKVVYQQLFYFQYKDGAKMVSTGGLLHERRQQDTVDNCSFSGLSFVSASDQPYRIEVPNLTNRELRHLDAQLPQQDNEQLEAVGVPSEELRRYAKVYRYYPTYAEAEL